MWDVLNDVRFAFRSLLKAPGLTFVVVLTLAVAIGANTAIFSVVESVLLKPLPYPDEDRIVRVAATVRESAGARGDRGNSFSDRCAKLRQVPARVTKSRCCASVPVWHPVAGGRVPLIRKALSPGES